MDSTGGTGIRARDRFLNAPELLQIVLGYLSRDRVDLLALALVSKSLRAQALRVWAKHLDLPVTAASRRLRLFQAHPDMLAYIRYLRVRSDVYDTGLFGATISASGMSVKQWTHLNDLLKLIAARESTASGLPLVDLTISPQDRIRIPPVLMKRVVALRIISSGLDGMRPDHVDQDSGIEEPEFVNPGTLPPPSKRQRIDGGEQSETEREGTWDDLTELIHTAGEGPGLRTFHLGDSGPEPQASDGGIPALLWSHLNDRHSQTLQDLSLGLSSHDLPDLFLTAAFTQLRIFHLSQSTCHDLQLLEEFFDWHPQLTHICLDIDFPSDPFLSYSQTFPELRWLYTNPPFPTSEFAQRHPKILSNIMPVPGEGWSPHMTPVFENSTEYLKQRFALVFCSQSLSDMVNADLRLSHIYIGCQGYEAEALVRYFPTLLANPAAVQAITCLKIDVDCMDLDGVFAAFDATAFPNLVELALIMSKCTPSYTQDDVEARMAQFIARFVPARSLRILRICEGCARCPSREVLIDHEFPPALEYFGWLDPPICVPQYFRFVPSNQDGRVVKTEGGGKRGRLQRVPGIFRARVTPEGVWERPFDENFTTAILDHISGPSPC